MHIGMLWVPTERASCEVLRATKIMKKFVLIALLVGAAAVAIAWPWLRNEIAIDSCLDAGGRWNYDEKRCEGAAK
jgi:hypothetical protein